MTTLKGKELFLSEVWWISCGDIEGSVLNKGQSLTATAMVNNKLNSCHKKKKLHQNFQSHNKTGRQENRGCVCPVVVYLTHKGMRDEPLTGSSGCMGLAHHRLQSVRSVFPAHAPTRRTQTQHCFPSLPLVAVSHFSGWKKEKIAQSFLSPQQRQSCT